MTYINSEVADVSRQQPQHLLHKKWYVASYVCTAYQLNLAGSEIDKDNTSEMRRAMSVHGSTINFFVTSNFFLSLRNGFRFPNLFRSDKKKLEVTNESSQVLSLPFCHFCVTSFKRLKWA